MAAPPRAPDFLRTVKESRDLAQRANVRLTRLVRNFTDAQNTIAELEERVAALEAKQ